MNTDEDRKILVQEIVAAINERDKRIATKLRLMADSERAIAERYNFPKGHYSMLTAEHMQRASILDIAAAAIERGDV